MPTYYINADTGNDTTGDGSALLPWETLDKANQSTVDGDTVVLQNSVATYELPATYTLNHGLSFVGLSDDASGAQVTKSTGTARIDIFATTTTVSFEKITFRDMITSNNYSGGVGAPFIQLSAPFITLNVDQCRFTRITAPSSFGIGGMISCRNGNNAPNAVMNITNNLFIEPKEGLGAPPSGATASPAIAGCRQALNVSINILDNSIYLATGHQFGVLYYHDGLTGAIIEKGNLVKDSGVVVGHSHIRATNTQESAENHHNGVTNLPAIVTGDSTNLTDDPLWVDEANHNFNLAPGSTAIDSRSIE